MTTTVVDDPSPSHLMDTRVLLLLLLLRAPLRTYFHP